jgi:hypothetical protein
VGSGAAIAELIHSWLVEPNVSYDKKIGTMWKNDLSII